jgi:hypothetical protein
MKKIIRLNENDLKKIINIVVETNFAAAIINKAMQPSPAEIRAGITKDSEQSSQQSSQQSGQNVQQNDAEKKVIKWTNYGIKNGVWVKDDYSENIKLSYKDPKENASIELSTFKPSQRLKNKSGTWRVEGQKLIYN